MPDLPECAAQPILYTRPDRRINALRGRLFRRGLTAGSAYLRPYTSNTEHAEAFEPFLHTYNYHRCHTALGGQPPITRVNNPPGQYTSRRLERS